MSDRNDIKNQIENRDLQLALVYWLRFVKTGKSSRKKGRVFVVRKDDWHYRNAFVVSERASPKKSKGQKTKLEFMKS